RYGELKKRLPDTSLKVYNDHLKELINDGLLFRQVFAEVPPRTEYSLTSYAQTLIPALQKLMEWGLVHLQKHPEITDKETYKKVLAYFGIEH
ncbi:MAG: helix-turn-helix domain-containing protein, partial [Bacteroidota bacterium]